MSSAEAQALDAGTTVAFAMSGWSVGGYAPGATSVRLSGAGIDLSFPVGEKGWWLGEAEMLRQTIPLLAADRALVVASGRTDNGSTVGSDPLMRIKLSHSADGRVLGFAVSFI